MVVKYSSLDRLEPPKMILCSPGSVYDDGLLTNVVGILTDHEAEEVVFNFNATSELNFRVTRIMRENSEENEYIYNLFRSIQNRRLIFLEDIGYFMITNVDNGFDGYASFKDVTAQSIDVEIQQKMLPYIPDGTYRFQTEEGVEGSKGILETIVETLPLWTIGEVDSTVASKWRTFEDVDTSLNCLAFLLENIQDAYECIVLFDIINRTINVYDQNNYVRQTDIHITKDDVINSIDITENADDLYTAISVLGDENVTISAINPTGTNTLYNFDYYLDWMPSALAGRVTLWESLVDGEKDTYYNNSLSYYNNLDVASDLQSEIDKLNIQLTMYQRCRDNIVAESGTSLVDSYNAVIVNNGGTPIEIYNEISQTLSEIDDLMAQCESDIETTQGLLNDVNSAISIDKAYIDSTNAALAITNYFTQEEYTELCHYIYEGSYRDEYVVITDIMSYEEKFSQMKILYDRAEARLERVSSPTQEFDIDVENFIFAKDFKHWSDQLETGCLINVELDTNDVAPLFLSNITVNYDDHSLSMTFGNRFNKFDPKSLFENVLGNISKSANTIDYIKEILYPIKSGEFNEMKEALQASRDLTMDAALSSANEEVIIDGSGYTGRKLLDSGTYDPHQVKITGKNIVFTDDAWETSKVAIGELLSGQSGEASYGINAESIIGDLIMGNNLRIIDNNGNDLLSVVDGRISAQVGAAVSDVDEYIGSTVEMLEDSITLSVSEVQNQVNSLEDATGEINARVEALEGTEVEVDHVTTTTGYTFNADGLTISKDGEEMTNLIDNTGMYVKRSNAGIEENVLVANNEGVNAINLTARQYLIVGDNSRFENYSNGTDTHRTACFYTGV